MTQKFYQIDINILKRLGYNVILSNRISDAFKFWKYDIVFGYFFRYSFFVALIAKIFCKKSYLTGGIDSLDIDFVGKKEYLKQKWLFKLCYLVANKCIIVSREDLRHVEEIIGKRNESIVYSEHTIDTSAFVEGPSFEKKSNNFVTIGWQGSVGNVKRKGIDKAIVLFFYLKQNSEFKDSKLFILGRLGNGTEMIKKIINKYGLESDIFIIGEVSEKQKIDYLKKNRYYFQLSHYEGFGMAALEALVAGDVIIHSGKGGLKNPIYSDHILVDIDMFDKHTMNNVYDALININYDSIKHSKEQCLLYYDNKRRLNDFDKILSD